MRGISYLRKNVLTLEDLHRELEHLKNQDLTCIQEGRSFKVLKINKKGYIVDLDAFLLRATELPGNPSDKRAIVEDVIAIETKLLDGRIKPETTLHPLWKAISSLFTAVFGIATREKLLKRLRHTDEGVRPEEFKGLAQANTLEDYIIHDDHPEDPSWLKIERMKPERVYVFSDPEETVLHFHYVDKDGWYTHEASLKSHLPELGGDFIYVRKEASGLRYLEEAESFEELRAIMDEVNPQKVVIGWLGGRYFKTLAGDRVSLNVFLKKALEVKNKSQGKREDAAGIIDRVKKLDGGARSFSILHLFRQVISFSWLTRKRLIKRLESEVHLRGYILPSISLEEGIKKMEEHIDNRSKNDNRPAFMMLKKEGTLNGYILIKGDRNFLGESIAKAADFSLREDGTIWTQYGLFSSVDEFLNIRVVYTEAGEEIVERGYWVETKPRRWYNFFRG